MPAEDSPTPPAPDAPPANPPGGAEPLHARPAILAGPKLGQHPWRMALALGIFLFALFALTTSKLRFGYEGANIDQAEALIKQTTAPRPILGGIEPYTQGGLIEVAAYLPFAEIKMALQRRGALPGLQQLVYPMAIPFYTTLLCLIFFALAYELYRRTATAAALTLILALATTIWPYAKYGMETQQTLWTLAAAWAIARRERRGGDGGGDGRSAAGGNGGGLALAFFFGMTLAALALTKITGPLQAAVLAGAALWNAIDDFRISRRGRLIPQLVAALIPCSLGALVFLWSNHWRYGGLLWGGRYGADAETAYYPLWDAVWAIAASPGKSIFLFSPPLFAALWFWGAFWRRFPALRAVIILLLPVALFHLCLRPWADETWGPRRLHFMIPLALLPLGVWWERRGALAFASRWLMRAALLAGFAVQLLAISFDYTALFKVAGVTDLYSQERSVWDPQLCPLRFDLHLLRSALARAGGYPSIPFTYKYHYLHWWLPPEPPAAQVFPLRDQDRFDFWPAQQRRDFPGRPYWFHAPSSWLALGLAGVVTILGIGFTRRLRRDRPWEFETEPERGWALYTGESSLYP